MDRQGIGLAVVRICIGVFFLFEGLAKFRWFGNPSILSGTFAHWLASAGPMGRWYLERIAIPGLPYFARLVPLGEIACGLALIAGVWTPLAAFVAFFMAINYHVAGGTLLRFSFLTNGYGLPVLGSTLGLAIGGIRLPWSVR